jgi:uncharacterized membrane protein
VQLLLLELPIGEGLVLQRCLLLAVHVLLRAAAAAGVRGVGLLLLLLLVVVVVVLVVVVVVLLQAAHTGLHGCESATRSGRYCRAVLRVCVICGGWWW